ncbi:hypothetical protein GCM10028808_14210 [Spirosoma migulaei]
METLRYVVLANALLAVVSIAYYALLRRETFFGANRLALWLGLAGALLLPLLELPDWRPERVRTVMHRTAQVIVPKVLPNLVSPQPTVTITLPNQKTYKAFQDQPVRFVWSWQIGILLLYSSGVFLLLTRFGIRLVSLQQLIRKSVHESYTDFTLVHNKDGTSPFSFFNWVVLNPDQHSPDELDQILRHERVHVRQLHSFDMIGAELVCIVLWFNPAAYLFRQLLHQTLEFSADRAVLAEGIDARLYQYNLIKVSMSGGQLAITNQFSGPTLRQRVSMMNSQRSGSSAWWRYGIWTLLIGMMALACRHGNTDYEGTVFRQGIAPFPLTNATRVLAAELEKADMPFSRESALLPSDNMVLINGKRVTLMPFNSYSKILYLQNNHLALKLPNIEQAKVFINGQASSASALSALTFEQVSDLFVYQKWDDAPKSKEFPELYRVFISTTHKTPTPSPLRTKWKQYLQANAISDYPLGNANTFSMNKLLEATFFNNKLAFVKRTKNEHLKLYDELVNDTDLYINGLPTNSKGIESVHVREVDKLYTRERPFEEWADGPTRQHRFVLYIQTSPKRAKRDSSYYVFSPFYSGDF